MENLVILIILIFVIGGIVLYLLKAKKQGQTCIGCPYAKQCKGSCSSQNGCVSHDIEGYEAYEK